MHSLGSWIVFIVIVAVTNGAAGSVAAQEPEAATRDASLEQARIEKLTTLHPYVPGKTEALFTRAEDIRVNGLPRSHPFFESAYYGGGFTLGAGYAHHVSPYNMLDVRGSYTILGYKRIEAEFTAPRLFHRRGALSLLGGWREATQAAFYGFGMGTSLDNRADFDFQQPYGSATLTLWPTRRLLMLRGGVELSQWSQRAAEGSDFPSVEQVYTPASLPGLGTRTTYLHSQGTVGLDWRTSPGYSRRGGFYGVTLHDYADKDDRFGFRQVDYEAIQHVPILREAWVISLRAIARTTYTKTDQQVPFFLLPYVGSGSDARIHEPPLPRSERADAPGGVAHHGQPLHGNGGVLRHREGRRTPCRSRSQRAEKRLRRRCPFPRTGCHAIADRSGEESRRDQAGRLDNPDLLRLLPCSYHHSPHGHVGQAA